MKNGSNGIESFFLRVVQEIAVLEMRLILSLIENAGIENLKVYTFLILPAKLRQGLFLTFGLFAMLLALILWEQLQ
jgi:hypothetical protein